MSAEGFERLESTFLGALELRPEDRANFLRESCGDDPALLRELEGMLADHDDAEAYFEGLSGEIARDSALELESAASPRGRIGPWEIVEVLGRGGMGVVYRARRADGSFEQDVALKLLPLDLHTPAMRARFLRERQLLARLEHPHIARLLDGGLADDGRPYFVMELVDGQPVTEFRRRSELDMEALLRLFLDVVSAVAYLHRNLVVHRDLKPSNVLVDRDGRVRLLDFGIAKLLGDGEGEDGVLSGRTATGEQLLSLDYAAPEQIANTAVTTATDVYALGAVLYELLTGRRPFRRTPEELLARRVDLPTAPSVLVRSSAEGEEIDPVTSWHRLRGDLDTICLTALDPSPEERYPSAEQLGQDIERHLEGLPLRARPPSWSERIAKALRRNRRTVAAVATALVLLTAGFVRERGLRQQAEAARERAIGETAKVRAISEFTEGLLSSADPATARGRDLTVVEILDQASERLDADDSLAAQPEIEARMRLTLGRTYRSLGEYPEARAHFERAAALARDGSVSQTDRFEIDSEYGIALQTVEPEKAEEILRRVLEGRTELEGAEHPDTLEARNRLATVLWRQARYAEVEALDRETLRIRRRVLGERHPDTLRSINALAATLFNQARFAEAEPLFRQALAGLEVEGPDHPQTLKLQSNLAATLIELGRYDEAIELHREVLATRERVLGADHPTTATSHHNLGAALLVAGRPEEAVDGLTRAVEIRAEQEDPTAVLFSQSFLADALLQLGRLVEAEQLYLETLEEQAAEEGPRHASTLRTATKLAEARLLLQRPAEAEAGIREVIAVQREVLGEHHGDLIGSRTILGRIRLELGDPREALELANEALRDGRAELDSEHPLVLEALALRIRSRDALGDREGLLDETRFLVEARERRFGPDNRRSVAARELAASLGR